MALHEIYAANPAAAPRSQHASTTDPPVVLPRRLGDLYLERKSSRNRSPVASCQWLFRFRGVYRLRVDTGCVIGNLVGVSLTIGTPSFNTPRAQSHRPCDKVQKRGCSRACRGSAAILSTKERCQDDSLVFERQRTAFLARVEALAAFIHVTQPSTPPAATIPW